MEKNRVEAFSDGVIAIVITIMVLELKVPHSDRFALYGFVLLMAALSYSLLQHTIIAAEGPSSFLKTALGADWKGKGSPFLYGLAIAVAFFAPKIAQTIYVGVAMVWLIPDRRIERALAGKRRHAHDGN